MGIVSRILPFVPNFVLELVHINLTPFFKRSARPASFQAGDLCLG